MLVFRLGTVAIFRAGRSIPLRPGAVSVKHLGSFVLRSWKIVKSKHEFSANLGFAVQPFGTMLQNTRNTGSMSPEHLAMSTM